VIAIAHSHVAALSDGGAAVKHGVLAGSSAGTSTTINRKSSNSWTSRTGRSVGSMSRDHEFDLAEYGQTAAA